MNEYRKNVTIVLNFLKERGYAQSTVKNHERFYTLLADDLAAKDITYSPEYGKALLSTLPVPAWLPKSRIENAACISKLDDAYIHGCIINAQASPRKSYSKLSLNSNFENHITRFLRSRENVFTESQIANVKRRCSLFLKCMQSKGRMDPSEITYGDIDSYHEELAHLKRISRVIEESTLHQFLQFLAESGKVPYGLYLRIYALETECFVNLDDFPPDEQSRLIKNSSEGQVRLSPERFLSEGLELIRLHQEAGYVQKYTEASKRAILQLYLFLDYHNLWYDPDMADIWLHSDCVKKRLFKGCSWNTARHILFMFSDYVTSGSVHFEKKLPRGINGINNIPEWCLTPLLDFAESRRKMKLDENTVKNDIYSILRFCRFIIGEGLSSYGDTGILQTDGFQSYGSGSYTRVGCWSHARRKLIDCIPEKHKKSKAAIAVVMIDKMFKYEREARKEDYSDEQLLEMRREKIAPLVDEFYKFIDSLHPGNGSHLAEAVNYARNQKAALTVFLNNPLVDMSNNLAERTVKPYIIARKNFLFSCTEKGAHASAAVMTIIETAKRNGLDVYGYLLHLLTELPKYGHTPTREQLEALMPWSDSLPDFCKKKYSQVESVTIPEMSICKAKV